MNQCGDHEKIFCPILAINLTDAAYWTDLGSRTTSFFVFSAPEFDFFSIFALRNFRNGISVMIYKQLIQIMI